jgi:hypothetical protein
MYTRIVLKVRVVAAEAIHRQSVSGDTGNDSCKFCFEQNAAMLAIADLYPARVLSARE